jgi:3-hydroxyisobutyrate dehydrogenase
MSEASKGDDTESITIAFLGLGNMGTPMAAHLVSAGHIVRGYDPAPAARAAAEANGVSVLDSGATAVEHSDVVITMLPNGQAVRNCYRELLPTAAPGTIFVDSSTISVEDAKFVNRLAGERGIEQLDAPVSGGVSGAVAATLAFMAGGSRATLDRVTGALEPMASRVVHCGDSGAGQAAKISNNMVLAVHQIVIAEAFLLAERLGLSAQTFFDVITGSTGNCWAVNTNCPVPGPLPSSPANHDFAPGFATTLMSKDLGLAVEAIRATGTAAPMGTRAAAIFADLAAAQADKDFSSVIEVLRTGAYV